MGKNIRSLQKALFSQLHQSHHFLQSVLYETRRMKQIDVTRIFKHFCCSDAIIALAQLQLWKKGPSRYLSLVL